MNRLKCKPVRLERKIGVEPKRKKNIATCAPIPINLKKPNNKMIKEMVEADLIFEVTEATEFCSPRKIPTKERRG